MIRIEYQSPSNPPGHNEKYIVEWSGTWHKEHVLRLVDQVDELIELHHRARVAERRDQSIKSDLR